jgi:CubicO group peptidase (beta-lactamase class C family)
LTYGFFGNTEVDKLYLKADVLGQRNLKAMSKALAKLPLLSSPGDEWTYSVSVDLLGYLVEVVSETELDEFLKERIFEPLAMKDTGFFVRKDQKERFSVSYGPGRDGLSIVDDLKGSKYLKKPSLFSGGAGLVSTGPDYARFCQMLMNKGTLGEVRILAAETIEEMTRDHLPKKAFPIGFGPLRMPGVGFGLGFSVNVEGMARKGEYGWSGAASTYFWNSPQDDLFVVSLCQYQPYSPVLKDAIQSLIYAAIESE